EGLLRVVSGHSTASTRAASLRGKLPFRRSRSNCKVDPIAAVRRPGRPGTGRAHRDLGPADAVSVGMYLQTLMLALTARGLGTCVEVSVAGYPDVVRTELSIPPELTIICGLAVGYSDPDFPANKLHIGRDPIEKHVVFLDN